MLLRTEWSLDKCERFLESNLRGKTLIGEVELDQNDVRRLGALLGQVIATHSVHDTQKRVDDVWRQWPCCVACFTVGVFAHWYAPAEAGTPKFWPHIDRLLGVVLNASSQEMWRLWFEGFLRRRKMPTFERVPGQRMVKRVRIHAVLTAEGAKRLFSYIVEPAVRQNLDQEELSAENTLRELNVGCPPLRKPERDFLLYGEHVADDILERCCELYRAAAEGQEEAASSGLPERVIQAFQEWREHRKLIKGDGDRARVQRPYLRLDDYGNVVVALPTMSISPELHGVTVTITPEANTAHDEQDDPVPINIDRHASSTIENDIPLQTPASEYAVKWAAFDKTGSERVFRHNRVRALRDLDAIPWMAFRADGDECRYIERRTVPRGTVWLLHPSGALVKGIPLLAGEELGEPHAKPLDKLDELEPEGWSGFVAACYSTEAFSELRIVLADREVDEVYVPVDIEPRIVLHARLKGLHVDGMPVLSQPPVVDASGARDLMAFVRCLEPDRDAELLRRPIDEFATELDGRVGMFEMWARGRLGIRSQTVRFVLVSGMQVKWKRSLYPPGNAEPIELRVSAPSLKTVESAEKAVKIHRDAGAFRITAPPDTRQITLSAVFHTATDTPWNVILKATIPRILVGEGREYVSSLGVESISIQSSTLRSGRELYLWIAVEPTPAEWRATVVVLPLGCTAPLSGRAKGKVNLRQWYDSIVRQKRNQRIILNAVVDGRQFDEVALGTITLVPELKRLDVEGRRDGVRVKYQLDGPEVPCVLRIVHLDYPWSPPRRVELSADRRSGQCYLPADLPPGSCHFQLIPEGGQESTIRVPLCSGLVCDVPPVPGATPATRPATDQFEKFLARKVARLWTEIWNLGQEFNHKRAMEADAEMRSLVRCKAGKLDVPKDGWKKVAFLALWWWQQAHATGQPAAITYAKRAVRLLAQLFIRSPLEGKHLIGALQGLVAKVDARNKAVMGELVEFVKEEAYLCLRRNRDCSIR